MLKGFMSDTVGGLRPGQVLEGPSLPGRTEVVAVVPTGDLLRLVGKGLDSGQFVDLDRYAGRTSEQAVIDEVAAEGNPTKSSDFVGTPRGRSGALPSHHPVGAGEPGPEGHEPLLVGRLAEAREPRLVPEVVEDFFLRAATLHELQPRKATVGYRLGRVPRPVLEDGIRQEGRFGRLGRQYGTVVFDKKDLERVPTAEWVTPGHPLFEAVRGLTERTAAAQPYDRVRQSMTSIVVMPEVAEKSRSCRRSLPSTIKSNAASEPTPGLQSPRQYLVARRDASEPALDLPLMVTGSIRTEPGAGPCGRRPPMAPPVVAESGQDGQLPHVMQQRAYQPMLSGTGPDHLQQRLRPVSPAPSRDVNSSGR